MKNREMFWYRSDVSAKLQSLLLLPFAWLYCAVVTLRLWLYRSGLFSVQPFSVPVVVIGNVTVGGTGKTPFIIALSQVLMQRGYKPGIVSRGYGGEVETVHQVTEDDDANDVGDEPLMIYQRLRLPVVVGADRRQAVMSLLDANDCDIVLSDDGLQHLNMHRDMELVIVDASRGLGNGLCLPSGPLRERKSRLDSVDLVISNGEMNQHNNNFFFTLEHGQASRLNATKTAALSDLSANASLHAVAGIGNPERFFRQLENSGLSIIRHAFPDHHVYTQDDFAGMRDGAILMTEKDAVKCSNLGLDNAWYLPVNARFSEPLSRFIDQDLINLIKQKPRNQAGLVNDA